jgi:hypothetical protein
MHTDDLLTVHVQRKQYFLLLYVQAKNVALNIAESNDALLLIHRKRGNLILMIVKMLFIVQHAAHISKHLHGTVPRSGNYGLAVRHED